MEHAGYTPGEEDEQIFSYLSRIGATTKYMLPESNNNLLERKLIDIGFIVTFHILCFQTRISLFILTFFEVPFLFFNFIQVSFL